ncbi:MAG: elongation factor Ts [Clostridia bacterium]|nr:elongation factor Ts [Clostridia bacterium]
MTITAKDVAALRAKTGVGMMECKKALVEANGNEEEAIKLLRERGIAVAAKKSTRIAAEGVVDIAYCDKCNKAAIIEVNTESDFAAKNEKFAAFVKDLLKVLLTKQPATLEEFLKTDFDGSMDVEAAVKDKIFTVGENINIRRFEIIDGPVSTYVHGKGSIGVVVKMSAACDDPRFAEAAKNIALQIASMNPSYLDKASVPESVIANEKEVITAQIKNDEKNANKPDAVIEKMTIGKLNKFFITNCLMLQEYVKEDDISVEKYLANVSKEIGVEVKPVYFVRYEKGEGLEKKNENFAEEIAKLTNK